MYEISIQKQFKFWISLFELLVCTFQDAKFLHFVSRHRFAFNFLLFFFFLDQQITKTAEVYISSVCFVKRYFYLLDAKNLCIKNTLKKEHKNMKKFKKEN